MTVDAQLIEHMMEPKNYGSMADSHSEGIGKNPQNGEKVVVYIKVDSDTIDDIRFQAIGCSTTIVAGSMLTQEARGLSLKEIYTLVDNTMKVLEGVPAEDAVCTEMVALALKASVDTYEKRREDSNYPAITYQVKDSCKPKEETV
ncbi:Iron-sulfur cluster assembly scaffold protein IscU/NifU-like [hydrothermal vent metagenome]|uniref:Iron-sulfur cluster assembly scaffold protein IscU/NifU-like n=1 Tax=hydrothermal vent metagenome TaxID=652676 RepID=A0A1W1BDM2_9ZZZZ